MGDKYDRQLRLWGADGQKKLASTHILLLHASATGSEALKNLVLPGVERFTILDDHKITLNDCHNNFFVTKDHIGKSRAKIVTELLLEMNEDVTGTYHHENPVLLLQSNSSFLDQFQLVIATQVNEKLIRLLGTLCELKQIPLLIVNSYGLLGYLRIQTILHTVEDSKPDPPIHELSIAKPFPALKEFTSSFNLTTMSSIDHAHVPFVVILLQAMESWKDNHNGEIPQTFPEKQEFKDTIRKMANEPYGKEVNFVEAMDHAYKAYVAPTIPDDVQLVLTTARNMELNESTSDFWFLAAAIADFVDLPENGMLPMSGIVPDMTALTTWYVELQRIYVAKAQEDAKLVADLLQKRLKVNGVIRNISLETTEQFCKNASALGVVTTKSISDEWTSGVDLSLIDLEEEHEVQSPLLWYFLLRANGIVPLDSEQINPATILQKAKDLAILDSNIASDMEVDSSIGHQLASRLTLDHANEIVRFQGVELHNVAALLGGMTAQEAVKLITNKFIPLNHTYIYNGINGTSSTYNL